MTCLRAVSQPASHHEGSVVGRAAGICRPLQGGRGLYCMAELTPRVFELQPGMLAASRHVAALDESALAGDRIEDIGKGGWHYNLIPSRLLMVRKCGAFISLSSAEKCAVRVHRTVSDCFALDGSMCFHAAAVCKALFFDPCACSFVSDVETFTHHTMRPCNSLISWSDRQYPVSK